VVEKGDTAAREELEKVPWPRSAKIGENDGEIFKISHQYSISILTCKNAPVPEKREGAFFILKISK
jgi:hypothetical protein